MKISSKQLMSLPVVTESGQDLGTVNHFDIDVDTHGIVQYYIASEHIIKRLLKWENDLIITPYQVVAITAKAMIVKDTVLKEAELQQIKLSYSKQRKSASGASLISHE